MSERIFLIPNPGLEVLDPVSRRPLPADGEEVEKTTYWLRRLRDGDVTEGKAPKPKKAD